MAKIEVQCPKCGKTEVIIYGKSPEEKQRYKCKKAQYAPLFYWAR